MSRKKETVFTVKEDEKALRDKVQFLDDALNEADLENELLRKELKRVNSSHRILTESLKTQAENYRKVIHDLKTEVSVLRELIFLALENR